MTEMIVIRNSYNDSDTFSINKNFEGNGFQMKNILFKSFINYLF